MHPNIPDHMIKKTISDIQATSAKKKKLKESVIYFMENN
jgi:hypothetical protein